MTRSFTAVVRRDFSQVLTEHLLGPILFIRFLVAVFRITLELLFRREAKGFYYQLIFSKKFQSLTLLMVLTYYSLRPDHGLKSRELSVPFLDIPLAQLLS